MLCERTAPQRTGHAIRSLNPCSNGRCSASPKKEWSKEILSVLILVLMEDALRALLLHSKKYEEGVLILVLMEDALRVCQIQEGYATTIPS